MSKIDYRLQTTGYRLFFLREVASRIVLCCSGRIL